MTEYTWKMPGVFKADANAVAAELEMLGENVTPEQIVEAAKDESSELHKCFTWNDSEAAEKWRKQEARYIMCFLVVKDVENEESDKPSVRAFYKTDGEGYKPATKVFTQPDEYQKILNRAWAELRAFKAKYERLQELSEIMALIK